MSKKLYCIGMDSDPCSCKCHFGGAVSCPGCKRNHEEGMQCKCCND